MSLGPAGTATRELSLPQRWVVLAAAFAGWMFAGMEIALFVLIHRPAMVSLLGGGSPGAAVDETLVTQWFAWYQAAFLFGAASGGWVFGWLGDRFGRTQSLAWSVLCYSLFTGVCYFATSPWELLALRFVACHGVGGAWPSTVALVAEAWPAASRPFLAGLLGTAANVGQVLMGVVGLTAAVTAESWRWVFLVGAAPAVLGAWCLGSVPESVKWLSSRSQPKTGRRRTVVGVVPTAAAGAARHRRTARVDSGHWYSGKRAMDRPLDRSGRRAGTGACRG